MGYDGLENLTEEHERFAENPEIVKRWIKWKVDQMPEHSVRHNLHGYMLEEAENWSTDKIAEEMSEDEYNPNEGVDTFIVQLKMKTRDLKHIHPNEDFFTRITEENIKEGLMDFNSVLECEVLNLTKVSD